MKRIRVTVTQEDIDNGLRDSALYCPMARAATRAYGRGVAVWMGGVEFKGNLRWYPLPAAIGRWVRRYDRGRNPVQPATFLLPVPE